MNNRRGLGLRQATVGSTLLRVFCVVLLSLPSVAFAFNLVTAQEAEESAKLEAAHSAPKFVAKAFDPSAPKIDVISPDLSSTTTFQSPIVIHVKFLSKEGAEVVPDSFRAQYGAFRIDITDRLLKATKVTKEGIQVDKAELPAGNHRLFLKIQDTEDRVGEREVKFTIQ